MSTKTALVFCALAVLIQLALGQYIAAPCGLAGAGLAYGGYAVPAIGLTTPALSCGAIAAPAAIQFSPTSGGALPVSSASAIAPVGISVASDNVYEGALSVAGELPFVGTVAFENVLPTVGSGAVNHACGNGVNAMISNTAAYAPAAAIAPAAFAAPCFGGLGYII